MPDPAYIALFNQSQMDLDNRLFGMENLVPQVNPWVGELETHEGAPIAGAILVGPLTAEAPMDRKKWDAISLNGMGHATVMIWVDQRLVAKGRLEFGQGPGAWNRLKIPRGLRAGFDFLALVLFQGRLLGVEVFWTPMGDSE